MIGGEGLLLETILLVLKIIGIVILVTIALVLVLLAVVLFVPIRYKASLKKDDDLLYDYDGYFRISWLAGLIYFKVQYFNSNLKYIFRVFGIPVSSIFKNKSKKHNKEYNSDYKEETKKDYVVKRFTVKNEDNTDDKICKIDYNKEHEDYDKKHEDFIEVNKNEKNDNKLFIKFKKIIVKLKNTIKTIKEIPEIVRDIIATTKRIIIRIREDLSNLFSKIIIIKDFFEDNNNKEGFKSIKNTIVKLFQCIKPKRFQCSITFGFDDPAVTGQTLGIIAMTSPIHKDIFKIYPDFNEKRFECDLRAKGKIVSVNLIVIFLKLYFDKQFKYLIADFNRLKEEI